MVPSASAPIATELPVRPAVRIATMSRRVPQGACHSQPRGYQCGRRRADALDAGAVAPTRWMRAPERPTSAKNHAVDAGLGVDDLEVRDHLENGVFNLPND